MAFLLWILLHQMQMQFMFKSRKIKKPFSLQRRNGVDLKCKVNKLIMLSGHIRDSEWVTIIHLDYLYLWVYVYAAKRGLSPVSTRAGRDWTYIIYYIYTGRCIMWVHCNIYLVWSKNKSRWLGRPAYPGRQWQGIRNASRPCPLARQSRPWRGTSDPETITEKTAANPKKKKMKFNYLK